MVNALSKVGFRVIKQGKQLNQLYEKGKYKKAAQIGKRILEIREKSLDPEHPDTAQSLNNLGLLYDKIGDYAKAGSLYKHSLAIQEKSLRFDYRIARTHIGLALLYGLQGRNQEDLNIFQSGLAIEDRAIQNVFPIASEKQKKQVF